MSPERVARLVAWWVRLYTRGLPAAAARRRIDEIDADLHDHVVHERAAGTGEGRIASGIASRMVRGLAADLAWRGRQARAGAVAGRRRGRSLVRVGSVVGCILLVPMVATLLTDAVAWGPFDVALAGVLLMGAGLALDHLVRRGGGLAYRSGLALALAAALLLMWMVGALGVIADDGDGADMMYAGVLAVGVGGAVLARLRPAGMARALLATALAQATAAAVALAAGRHEAPGTSVLEILGVNGMFVALFAGSAWLLGRAARPGRGQGRAAPGGPGR